MCMKIWSLSNGMYCCLGCTDAAPEASHLRLTRCDAATREGRRWPRVGLRLPRGFFFFSPTRADAAEIRPDSRWFTPTRAISAEIGEMAGSSRNGRFRPKFKHSLSLRHSSLFSVLSAVCVCLASLNHSPPLCLCSPSRHLHSNPTQMLLSCLVFQAGLRLLKKKKKKKKKKKHTNATLLARELQYKNLWLPQNALCFVFYWTP